jgi:hypothetical protein
MAKKGTLAIIFKKDNLVTLKILVKLRLTSEMLQLPVRVIKCVRSHQYSLMSKHGQLKGLYPGSDLNCVDSSSASILGYGISIEQPKG